MTEPRYVKIYCATACKREMSQSKIGDASRMRRTRKLGLTLAEKVDGRWRCRCCGKPVSVTW